MTVQPKKRGAKNYFTGSRLTFLEGHCDKYISLRGKSRHEFWHALFNDWWQKYPWRLPDNEEPPADDPARMAELSYAGGDEDSEAKVVVEARVRKVSPFNRRKTDLVMIDTTCRGSPRGSVTEPLPEATSRVTFGLLSSNVSTSTRTPSLVAALRPSSLCTSIRCSSTQPSR